MNESTADALSNLPLAEGRWWKVTLDRKSNAKPIRVSLMETTVPGRRESFSTELGYERTEAHPSAVRNAAATINMRVAAYLDVVGSYPPEEKS